MSNTTFYSSQWDIDQLYLQSTVNNITLSQTSFPAVITYTLVNYSLTYPPVAEAQFQLTSDTVWRQFNDTNFSGGVNINMFLASTPTALNLVYSNLNTSNYTVNVRYYVWTDQVTN